MSFKGVSQDQYRDALRESDGPNSRQQVRKMLRKASKAVAKRDGTSWRDNFKRTMQAKPKT